MQDHPTKVLAHGTSFIRLFIIRLNHVTQFYEKIYKSWFFIRVNYMYNHKQVITNK